MVRVELSRDEQKKYVKKEKRNNKKQERCYHVVDREQGERDLDPHPVLRPLQHGVAGEQFCPQCSLQAAGVDGRRPAPYLTENR